MHSNIEYIQLNWIFYNERNWVPFDIKTVRYCNLSVDKRHIDIMHGYGFTLSIKWDVSKNEEEASRY